MERGKELEMSEKGVDKNRQDFGSCADTTSETSEWKEESDLSDVTSPRKRDSYQEYRDPKKWVKNEEVLVPGHDEDEEGSVLQGDEHLLWNELFPDELNESGKKSMESNFDEIMGNRKALQKWKTLYRYPTRFWAWACIIILQITGLTLGICTLVYQPPGITWDFQIWRICFLVVLLPFTWLFGDLFCWLVIKFVEKAMFTIPNALYFAYATKGPLRWVMRSLALTILWALMMTVGTGRQNSEVNTVYGYILKVLGCITLFFTANLLKRLAAKSLALNLNKGKQQYKLEAALTKEKILRALLKQQKKNPSGIFGSSSCVEDSSKVSSRKASKFWGLGGLAYGRENKSTSIEVDIAPVSHSETTGSKTLSEVKTSLTPMRCSTELEEEEGRLYFEKECDSGDKLNTIKIESPRNSDASKAVPVSPFTSPRKSDTNANTKKQEKIEKASKRKDIIVRLNMLETYIRNHKLSVSFNDDLNQKNVSKVENEMEAKRVGSFVFWNIKGDLKKGGITKSDLKPYVCADDLDLAFAMLDIDGNGSVDLKECIEAVESIYKERKNLANTLRDARNITKTLENLIGIIVHVLFIFLYLLVFQADVSEIWVSFSGVILGFSFIFSRTVSEIFDNVVFLFGTHPYAIGDLLNVNNEQMTVEEITLNFTCMMTSSNRTIWMPNQYLIKNPFTNLSTSGNFFESIVVFVDMDTSAEILGILQTELERVRENNPTEFGDALRTNFEISQVPLKLGIKVVYEYPHPAVNFKRTAEARCLMHAAIARVLTDNNIVYTWPKTKGEDGSQNINTRAGAAAAAIETETTR